MKQIETGCLAIIIGARIASNNGKVVTVGRYIGYVEGFEHSNHWEVSERLLTIFGTTINHAPQQYMLRIDGNVEMDEEESELELSESGSKW